MVLFDATLYPHRSLSAGGFQKLMVALAVLLSIPGLYALSLGYWPVSGFCIGEFFLIRWLFRRNYAHARMWERVILTERDLIVERHSHTGQVRVEKYEPTWLSVQLAQPVEADTPLKLVTNLGHGVVGSFLSPEERAGFAAALRQALRERPAKVMAADAQAMGLRDFDGTALAQGRHGGGPPCAPATPAGPLRD